MENRQSFTRFSARPIVTALTILFTLVLGLIGGYALAEVGHTSRAGTPPAAYIAPLSVQGPDASERNDNLRMQQLSRDQAHGH